MNKIIFNEAYPDVEMPRARWQWPRYVMALIAMVALVGWSLRLQILNGFSHVLGDVYDNTIEVSILEHWYNVFRGLTNALRTNYFFPYPATLGYNDGYFIYGIIYSLFRKLGSDPYLASALVNVTLRVACMVFFMAFALRVLKIRFVLALVGGMLFACSNSLNLHAFHAQLLSVAFAPLCALLLFFTYEAMSANQWRRLLKSGTTFSIVYASWAMTAYYMLWFFTFFTVVFFVISILLNPRVFIKKMGGLDGNTALALVAVVGVLGLALTPFLMLYLPKSSETGMHPIAGVIAYVPVPYDILNIGIWNYVYSGILPKLNELIGYPLQFSEKQTGFTPILLFSFIVSGFFVVRHTPRGSSGNLVLCAVAAVLVTYILTLNINGAAAWNSVFEFFPGAKGLRVVSRYYIFLTFPVISVVVYALSRQKKGKAYVAATLFAVYLLVEQLGPDFSNAIDRRAAVQNLSRTDGVPPGCSAFFVTDPRPPIAGQEEADFLYRHNVAAMLISEYVNLPTINGFSTFNPPDWHFDKPQLPDYITRVRAYQASHHLKGLCGLDLDSMQWSKLETNN